MNKLIRLAAVILTSPLWLTGGFLCLLVFIPIYLALFIAGLIEYGFTGDPDLLKQMIGK